tara:strand:- start:660 stop:1457 length:798 start_codon:yes stop_codon:yes gene_type:complete
MGILKKIFTFIIIIVLGVFIYGKFFFDVNDYRENITSYLSQQIDYEVTYKGTINLVYEPSPKITVTGILISDTSKKNALIAEIEELELNIDKEKIVNGIIDVEKAEIRNMSFYGINIDEALMKSYTLIKEQKYKEFTSQNFTSVEVMKARAIIDNQMMKIENINIATSLLFINGKGKLNIQAKQIDFDMIGTLREKKDVIRIYKDNYPIEIYGNNIPIKITGPVDKLNFQVDLTDIVTKQIINPIKEKIIDELEEKILEQIKLPF